MDVRDFLCLDFSRNDYKLGDSCPAKMDGYACLDISFFCWDAAAFYIEKKGYSFVIGQELFKPIRSVLKYRGNND